MESVKIKVEFECPVEELSKLRIPDSIWDLLSKFKQSEKKTEESEKSTDKKVSAVEGGGSQSANNRIPPGARAVLKLLRKATKPMTKEQIKEKSRYSFNYITTLLLQLEDVGLVENVKNDDASNSQAHYYRMTEEGIERFDRNDIPAMMKIPRVGSTIKDYIVALLVKHKAPMSHLEIMQQTGYTEKYSARALEILKVEGRVVSEPHVDDNGKLIFFYGIPKKSAKKKSDKDPAEGKQKTEPKKKTSYQTTSTKAKRSVLVLLKKLKGHVSVPELLYKGKYTRNYLYNTLRALRDENLINMEILSHVRYYSLSPQGEKLLSSKA